jgi:hypothetical protein
MIAFEWEKDSPRHHIHEILNYLCTEHMTEEEFSETRRRWFNERFMFGGFEYAVRELRGFWRKSEVPLKALRLYSYKGIDLILKKLEENIRAFFTKGGDVEITFTDMEIESIRSGKKKECKNNGN